MSEILTLEDQFLSGFEKWLNDRYAGSNTLKDIKQAASDRFLTLGLPQRKSEAYKYTPITKMIEKNFDLDKVENTSSLSKSECEARFYADDEANHLVFINGTFVTEYSRIVSADSQLTIEVLDEHALEKYPELKENLGQVNGSQVDAFAALNLAYFDKGLFIKAAKNANNQNTYLYHFIENKENQTVVFPRVFIHGATGSKTRVYEKTFFEGQSNSLNISIVESIVESNAEIRYSKLQNYDISSYAVEGIYAHQSKDSRFYTNTFTFRGALIRNNIYINIDAENCEGHMNGLYQLSGKSHVDSNTSVDHLKAHSYSNELYKGILDENSRGVFNGKIYVRPDAQKTNAFQSNNNILLSDSATINTKPQLEIWADDVQCSHGCTTGQLDEDAIFYLQARGVNKPQAKALLLNAFAKEALNELQNDLVKEEIEEIILNKLQ